MKKASAFWFLLVLLAGLLAWQYVSDFPRPSIDGNDVAAAETAFPAFAHLSEARVNTFTGSSQENPALAIGNQEIAVVWDSRRQQQGTYGVYLQRFDLAGARIGPETQVNLQEEGMQRNPAVAVSRSGATWVAWESFGQDGSMNSVVARSFSPTVPGRGWHGGDEILVNQTTAGNQAEVVIAPGEGGTVFFVWTTAATDNDPQRIMYRKFDSGGHPLCDESPVHAGTRHQNLPAVAIDSENQLIIVWAETELDGRPAGIFAKLLDQDGQPASQVFQANIADGRSHIEPAVAATAQGFAITWLRSTDLDYEVLVRQFDRIGNARHQPITVSPPRGQRVSGASVAASPAQGLVVAWNRSNDGGVGRDTLIEAQRLDFEGQLQGQVFPINFDNIHDHALTLASGKSRVGFDMTGRLFAVWSGNGGGDETGVSLTSLGDRTSVAFSLQQPPDEISSAAAPSTARPHEPPTYRRRDEAKSRFGGDRFPFSRGLDFGFVGIVSTGWTPPDPSLAAGPAHLVAMTNGEIAYFGKDGELQFQDEIENAFGFWGELGADNFVFDPEVLFDPHSNRFFAMACERSDDSRSMFLLAVSDDADPNGDWIKYRFDVTDLANDTDIDSPNMAVDEDTIYLTADFFGPSRFFVYTLDKAQVLAGLPNPASASRVISGSQSYGLAQELDAGSPALYMIRGDEFTSSTQLHLTAITNPLGDLETTTFSLTVPQYGHPVDPVSMGTTARPELFESRFWSCVHRNGSLWAVHHQSPDSSSDVARVRWYEIDLRGWPVSGELPVLQQSGDILPNTSTWTFFPSIWVDEYNNAAITFAKSSSSEFISMCRTLRAANDPPGQFQPFEVVRTSDAAYTRTRWGDYSGTGQDPAEPGVFWGMHEYSPGMNSWNTWIGQFEMTYADVVALTSKLLDGVIAGGTVVDLDFSDDVRWQLDPSPTANPRKQKIEVILQSMVPAPVPSGLAFRLEAVFEGGPEGEVIQTVELYNYQTDLFEVLDVRPASLSEVSITLKPTGDLSRFFHPVHSETTARIRWETPDFSVPPFYWTLEVDQAIWKIIE